MPFGNHLLPALGDRWRLIAPDLPGFGYSGTPDRAAFSYTFDGYAGFLERLQPLDRIFQVAPAH